MSTNTMTYADATGIRTDRERQRRDIAGTRAYWDARQLAASIACDDRFSTDFYDYVSDLAEDIAIEEAKRGNDAPMLDCIAREDADD
jgi:hypothetical protein